MPKHHIIYLPGLGDGGLNLFAQRIAIGLWRRRYGLKATVCVVGWASVDETFDQKLQRVLDCIDAATANNQTVTIVAPSAGASMGMHAFAARAQAVHRLVGIAPAFGPVEDASPAILGHNPALKDSLERQPKIIASLPARDRQRILSVKPAKDRVVPLRDMNIQGIHYLKLSTKGHLHVIAAALTVHSSKLVRFIKNER